mgnify:CR=1 FL=1
MKYTETQLKNMLYLQFAAVSSVYFGWWLHTITGAVFLFFFLVAVNVLTWTVNS